MTFHKMPMIVPKSTAMMTFYAQSLPFLSPMMCILRATMCSKSCSIGSSAGGSLCFCMHIIFPTGQMICTFGSAISTFCAGSHSLCCCIDSFCGTMTLLLGAMISFLIQLSSVQVQFLADSLSCAFSTVLDQCLKFLIITS